MTKHEHWTTLRRDALFTAGPVHEIAVEVVRLPDGSVVPDYYSIRLRDFALVYAELDDGAIVVLRQYKHGVRRVCLTFPGGAIADGESPLAAAQRELLEETGCESMTWHSLGAYVTNANQGCNTAHLFRATGCRRTAQPRTGDLEQMTIEYLRPPVLISAELLREIGLASHVALLLMATHPGVTLSPAG